MIIKRGHGMNATEPEWARRLIERCRIADMPWCDHAWLLMPAAGPVEQAHTHWRFATVSSIVSTGMFNGDFERISDQAPGMTARQVLDYLFAYGDAMQDVSDRPICWYMNLKIMQDTGIDELLEGTTLLSDRGYFLRRARWKSSVPAGMPTEWYKQYAEGDDDFDAPLPGFSRESVIARQVDANDSIRRQLFGPDATDGACSINLADERMLLAV